MPSIFYDNEQATEFSGDGRLLRLQPGEDESMFGEGNKRSSERAVQQFLAGLGVWAALLVICALFF
jgi:hypothetical protein